MAYRFAALLRFATVVSLTLFAAAIHPVKVTAQNRIYNAIPITPGSPSQTSLPTETFPLGRADLLGITFWI